MRLRIKSSFGENKNGNFKFAGKTHGCTYVALQLVHELAELRFKFTADADEGQLPLLTGVIGELRPEKFIATLLNKRFQGSVQRVVVLLDKLVLRDRDIKYQLIFTAVLAEVSAYR